MKTDKTRRGRREQTLRGIGVAAGIGLGPAQVVDRGGFDVPERRIAARDIGQEQTRFAKAVAAARQELANLAARGEKLPVATRNELGYVLDAHLQMLSGSRLIRGVDQRIGDARINAEAAVKAELSTIADAFAAMDDPYLATRAQDVREVAGRLIRHLVQAPTHGFGELPEGAVLIAEELTPADIALLDPERVSGFATELGGPQGHTAIMARSLGLPAVLGVPGLVSRVNSGDSVIIDGGEGHVVVRPDPNTITSARRQRSRLRRARRKLDKLRDLPAVTRDGVEIRLQANLELPAEVANAIDAGAQGVGLLRTEFMFMNRDTPPDAEEQYQTLVKLLAGIGDRPVTVRTLDIGGDKLAYALDDEEAEKASANPALGLRAIRLSLRHRPLLAAQLEAILRASAHGSLRVLLPMITTVAELRRTRAMMRRVASRLVRENVPIATPLPPLGVMVETPAAALSADRLVADADFLSLGTNDLTMYTLAVDRGDDRVAYLYDPLHPAVLRLIQFTKEAGANARIPVNLCGEIAGDPRFTALLLGLGLTDFSMATASLPAVKQRIRKIDASRARALAENVMRQSDARRIAVLIDAFNGAA